MPLNADGNGPETDDSKVVRVVCMEHHDQAWPCTASAVVSAAQLTFDVETEAVAGDPAYNAWLAAGRPEMDLLINKAVTAALNALDKDLARVVLQESQRCVVVHDDQLVDPFWLAGRKLVRSPHVQAGTAYEFDPEAIEQFGAQQLARDVLGS